MTFSLVLLAAAAATHHVEIQHAGSPVEAVYTARADIETRTVGAYVPNRADMRRCLWKATLVVERQLGGHPATPRVISSDRELSGSRAGACTEGNRRSIEQEVANRDDAITAHLLAVAERDRTPLLAELDVVRHRGTN